MKTIIEILFLFFIIAAMDRAFYTDVMKTMDPETFQRQPFFQKKKIFKSLSQKSCIS